jgi:hypothetical protein
VTNQDSISRKVVRQVGERDAQLTAKEELSLRFIRAEANLLRLPLFALHTKGLRTLDGIECTGSTTRGGQTQEFVFRVTRNTSSLYPGPLSRKIHFALIDIATRRGLPLTNPITWSWRDLCRRMNISYGGSKTVRELKSAIRSTHGIVISTQYALYSRADGQPLPNRERGHHFYEDFVFVNDQLPDGRPADINHVWLADWYLANINALFTAPLDYQLWIKLEQKSPIASRLYEFLLINFYSGTPVLRINYPNLAQFLPIQTHRFASLAERQLAPAFALLIKAEVIKTMTWGTSRDGVPQLLLHRGDRLTAPGDREQPVLGFMEENFTGSVAVKELRNIKPPEWGIVADFYRFWEDNENHRPSKKELEQARDYLDQYGPRKAKDVVSRAMKQLKKQWPTAKTFGALSRYIPEAAAAYDREQQAAERRRAEERRKQDEEAAAKQRQAAERALSERWLPVWEGLSAEARAEIQAAVVAQNPYLQRPTFRDSWFATQLYLEELSRRFPSGPQELANRSEASQINVADGPQTA